MTHVVVVGSGVAGITAALHACRTGCTVTLVSKRALEEGNTAYAQGGIAGVMFADDSVAAHVHDTMLAGAGLCDVDAVAVLAAEAPRRIAELSAQGVAFDRDAAGTWVKGLEAAHSYPRILHAGGDATGRAIERALARAARASTLIVRENVFLVDIVAGPAGHVAGVTVQHADRAPGHDTYEVLAADAVILATGGAGTLYSHTTNPEVATGDGVAAAIRVGARVADMEFVQFHPTVLAGPAPFLVSEAVRGEGATIVDDHGHRFLYDSHPDGELAPRDVVARALGSYMTAHGGRPPLLDATVVHSEDAAVRETFLRRRFPTIDAAVRAAGFDWARQPIPVTPAAHYVMGGIATDLCGRTSMPGLYAVGECACTGVHGANRLASNSLVEGAVFGARAGDVVAADAASALWPPANTHTATARVATAPAPAVDSTASAAPFTRARLQRLMWEHVGLTRDAAGLAIAARTLHNWQFSATAPRTVAEREDANLRLFAQAVIAAATARTASVGAHWRTDDRTGNRTDDPRPADTTRTPHGATLQETAC